MAVDAYLRNVPSDADPDDGRLYDPTMPDVGGVVVPWHLFLLRATAIVPFLLCLAAQGAR